MEWTREKTLNLISAYGDRRGLWDMTCDDYRKKDVKQRLLSEVRHILGGDIPISELEKKFHTLRTQYHREISRMKRKEPYNSKWFGFKNLQFLSSPRACRSSKGRVKTEMTEEGTVAKYIISEQVPTTDCSGESSSHNINDEFITLPPRKSSNNRSAQELEKLIEETTKDVEDIEDAKPKLIMKNMNVSYEQSYEEEVHDADNDNLENQSQQQIQPQPLEDVNSQTTIETVSFQANENGELQYQSSTSNSSLAANSSSVHHVMPTRIFKLPRRDSSTTDGNFYNEPQQQHQTQQHHQQSKRIYFDPTTHNTTIVTTPVPSTPNGSSTLITSPSLKLPRGTVCIGPPPPKPTDIPTATLHRRDEFSTYGEYVANEMRAITNREVLIALKHKINTAIFEANMAELHK